MTSLYSSSSLRRGDKPMRRGRMNRAGKGLGAAGLRRRRALVKRVGKKGKAWAKVRAELKKAFAAMGVTRCEVCGTDDGLGFAHSRKRRNITTDDQMREVALLCNRDHDALELQGEAKMKPAIEAIIEGRHERRDIH